MNELGTIEAPIVLTNTLSVGMAMDAVVRYTLAQPGNEHVESVNAVVGETDATTPLGRSCLLCWPVTEPSLLETEATVM